MSSRPHGGVKEHGKQALTRRRNQTTDHKIPTRWAAERAKAKGMHGLTAKRNRFTQTNPIGDSDAAPVRLWSEVPDADGEIKPLGADESMLFGDGK